MAAWPPTAACTTRFHVRHIDAVARDFVAIHVDQQAGLAELAHHGQLRESRNLRESSFDLERFVLQHVQVRAVDFHGQRALQSGERFVHGVFGGLRVIENHAGKASSCF